MGALQALDIKEELFDETMLQVAMSELRRINHFKTPGDKIACVVRNLHEWDPGNLAMDHRITR